MTKHTPLTVADLQQGYQDLERLGSHADEFRDDDQPGNEEDRDQMLRILGLEPECRAWCNGAARAIVAQNVIGAIGHHMQEVPPPELIDHLIAVVSTQLINGLTVGRLAGLRQAGVEL